MSVQRVIASVTRGYKIGCVNASKPVVPQLPGGPDPGQPVPRTPIDGFDLKAVATVTANLTAGREPRKAVLARLGLDEVRWLAVEKAWMLRVAAALLKQDPSLGQEYAEAFAVAQAELARGEEQTPPARG